MNTLKAKKTLAKSGIRTTADLDRWIAAHPQSDGCLISRFGALKILVGEEAACWILNDLAIAQCCQAV